MQPWQIGSLIGCNKASLCGDLYSYLIRQPSYSTPQQRQNLVRRMREAMVKCIILNGVPSVLEAVLAVASREHDEDKDYSFSRDGWRSGEENQRRGLDVLEFLYRDDFPKIMDKFHAHRDIREIHRHAPYVHVPPTNSC